MDKAKETCVNLLMGEGLAWENLGLALVGRALLSKALIQLFADGWGCAPSLVVVWPEATQPWVLWALCYGHTTLNATDLL